MSTSQASPRVKPTPHGPKLLRRLRALLLMEDRAYRDYHRLMGLQGAALEQGRYGLFLQRQEVEIGILQRLAALDRVILPLLRHRDRPGGDPAEIALEKSLHRIGAEVEAARRLALSENLRIQNLLLPVCHRLKSRLPPGKKFSRFSDGVSAGAPRFIEISA